jgi:O-antigen/teichoic acid export membrane protein
LRRTVRENLGRRFSVLASGPGLRAQLWRGGIGSALVKVSGTGLTLALTIVLARALGPRDYGLYSYVYALVGLLAIPAQLGLPELATRETAKAYANAEWATLKSLWQWTGMAACGMALLIIVVGAIGAYLFRQQFAEPQLSTFLWGLVLVPGLVLGRLVGGWLGGLHHVVAGQLPDMIMRPGLLLVFVSIVAGLHFDPPLSASRAMSAHTIAAFLSVLMGGFVLWRLQPLELSRRYHAHYKHRAWFASVVPFGFIAGMQLINMQADILMLGMFVSSDQVGIYRVSMQGAAVVAFGLQVVNMVAAPQIARMFVQGQSQRLQELATANARAAMLVAVPATLTFWFFGSGLLKILVGDEYAVGATSLGILALGQLVNAGAGSVVLLLNMTNHERVVARGVALAAVANVAANLILIPIWGMNGAATATTLTFATWNALLARQVAKKLGINSTIISTKWMPFWK